MSNDGETSLQVILDEISQTNPEIDTACIPQFFLSVAEKKSILNKLLESEKWILDLIPKEASIDWEHVVAKTIASFGIANKSVDVYAYSFLSLLSERHDNFAADFLAKYYEKIIEETPIVPISSIVPPTNGKIKGIQIRITPENLTEKVGLGGLVSPRFWSDMCIDIITQKNWRIPWLESPSRFLRKAVALDIAAMNNNLECPAEMFPYDVFWVDGNNILALASQTRTIDSVIEEMLISTHEQTNGGKILFIDNADFICEAGNGAIFLKIMTMANAMGVYLAFCGNGPNPSQIEDYVTNMTLEPPDKEGFFFLAKEVCENAISEHFVDCQKYSDLIAEKIWEVDDTSKMCNLVRFVDFICSSYRNQKTKIPDAVSGEDDFTDNFIAYLEKIALKPFKITKKHIERSFDLVFVKEIEQGKASSKGIVDLDVVLKKSVFGQDEAIKKMHESLIRAKANLRQKKGPLGVFLCLGASGVGKTYTAKQLQKAIYGNDKIIRLDMSEFADGTSVTKIFGASAGYIGYDDGAPFLAEVQQRPRSVVLIDEIEKAHELVKNAFLKIFDEGSAKNNRGELIDFSQTIIIVTGNVGSAELQGEKKRTMAFMDQESNEAFEAGKKEEAIKAIKSRFSPEFLNRMTEVIIYNNLSKDHVRSIVEFELSEIKSGCKKKGCDFSYDSGAVDILVDKSVSSMHNGGRLVGKVVRDEIETPLALEILKKNPKKAAAKGINQKIELKIV